MLHKICPRCGSKMLNGLFLKIGLSGFAMTVIIQDLLLKEMMI